MKTGFSRVCINPPLGVRMIGYFEPRSVKGIHDDIFVSAVSFDDGKEKALVVSIELLQLSSEKCDYFRNEMARSAGIKKEAIFLNFSHTHTAPTVGGRAHLDVEANPEYDKIFEEALCRAAREAFSDMRESELSYAEGEVSGVAFVRRFRMKDGSVRTNPGVDNPDIDYPLGAPDEGLKIVRIDRDGGENLVFVSFGLHADTVGGEYVSADWPGVVRDVVEKTIDNARLIFLLGAQGDVNHINVHPTEGERRGLDYATFDGVPRGYAHAEHIGRKIGGIAIGLYGKAEPVRADAVSFASKRIYIPSNRDNSKLDMAKKIKSLFDSGRTHELPYKDMELTTVVAEALRICQLENGPDGFEFTLTAFKLGGITLCGMPGECFAEIGRRIAAARGGEKVIVCCLTNGGDTYFPTSVAYDEGGYESRTSRLKKGADDILVSDALKLMKELEI